MLSKVQKTPKSKRYIMVLTDTCFHIMLFSCLGSKTLFQSQKTLTQTLSLQAQVLPNDLSIPGLKHLLLLLLSLIVLFLRLYFKVWTHVEVTRDCARGGYYDFEKIERKKGRIDEQCN